MSMDTQKRAVLILRMNQWEDGAAAETQRLLTERVISLGVRPDAIEVQKWRGVSGHQTAPLLDALRKRVVAGEVHVIAARDYSRLGRYDDATFIHSFVEAVVEAGGAFVTPDHIWDGSTDTALARAVVASVTSSVIAGNRHRGAPRAGPRGERSGQQDGDGTNAS